MDSETEIETIEEFVRKGNYHAAYNIALSALNAARKDSDQARVDQFIDIIRGIVNSLAEQFGSAPE